MEKPIIEFDGGAKDILLVFDDRIVIQHKGFANMLAMGVKGDKTIYYSDITSVQFSKPRWITSNIGYIQFSLPGGREGSGGILEALGDENSITVSNNKEIIAKAEETVELINDKIRKVKTRGNSAPLSTADELKKFKELLDNEVITKEEFEAKKKELLGQ
jgi:hypothetical protein